MSIEQAYFTRAKRAKFTGQAGYDVSDASRGINKKVSEAYIRPLGESIVFGGNSQADWAYCVTPSRQSRRIAVSRAFPASDGERTCQFVHTYLLDEDSVKQFFRRDGRDTPIVRVDNFKKDFVGEPGDGLDTVENLRFFPKPDMSLQNLGFDKQSFHDLLNLIVILDEGRGRNPALLRYIFVVYKCPREEFAKNAFGLASLLYSCLPYPIAEALGLVIKTDDYWRGKDSYTQSFHTVYAPEGPEQRMFIPGGELFIMNEPPTGLTKESAVITIDGPGRVTFSREETVKFDHENMISAMADFADIRKPTEFLPRFYKLLIDVVVSEINFTDVCNLYMLADALTSPEDIGKESDTRHLMRLLKLLNAAVKQNFLKADKVWIDYAKEFVGVVLQKDGNFLRQRTEAVAVDLLEIGLVLYADTKEEFLDRYYKFLVATSAIDANNEKLIDTLISMPEVLKSLVEKDTKDGYFVALREEFLRSGGAKEFAVVVRFLDSAELFGNEQIRLVDNCAERLLTTNESKAQIEAALDTGTKLGMFASRFQQVRKLKEFNLASPKDCDDYFRKEEDNLDVIIETYSLNDAWKVKYRIFQIMAGNGEEVDKVWHKIQEDYYRFKKKNVPAELESVKAYSVFCGESVTKLTLYKALLKFMSFDRNSYSFDWIRFTEYIFSPATGSGNAFMLFFRNAEIITTLVEMTAHEFNAVYRRLIDEAEKQFSDKTGNGNELLSIIKSLKIKNKQTDWRQKQYEYNFRNVLDLIKVAVSGELMQIYAKNYLAPAVRMNYFCDKCYSLTHSEGNSKPVCSICGEKLKDKDKTEDFLIVLTNANILEALIIGERPQEVKRSGGGLLQIFGGGKNKKYDTDNVDIERDRGIITLTLRGEPEEVLKVFTGDISKRTVRTCFIIDGGNVSPSMRQKLTDKGISYITLTETDNSVIPSIVGTRIYYKMSCPPELIHGVAKEFTLQNYVK